MEEQKVENLTQRIATQRAALRIVLMRYENRMLGGGLIDQIVDEVEYQMTEGQYAWAFKEKQDEG